MKHDVNINFNFPFAELLGINKKFEEILKLIKEIKVTEQEALDVLTKIDTTTSAIASNLTAVSTAQATEATVVQTISNDIDALLAASGSSIPADVATRLQAAADALQTSADTSTALVAATNAQIPTLQAIAAKGTPTAPPPPPNP